MTEIFSNLIKRKTRNQQIQQSQQAQAYET